MHPCLTPCPISNHSVIPWVVLTPAFCETYKFLINLMMWDGIPFLSSRSKGPLGRCRTLFIVDEAKVSTRSNFTAFFKKQFQVQYLISGFFSWSKTCFFSAISVLSFRCILFALIFRRILLLWLISDIVWLLPHSKMSPLFGITTSTDDVPSDGHFFFFQILVQILWKYWVTFSAFLQEFCRKIVYSWRFAIFQICDGLFNFRISWWRFLFFLVPSSLLVQSLYVRLFVKVLTVFLPAFLDLRSFGEQNTVFAFYSIDIVGFNVLVMVLTALHKIFGRTGGWFIFYYLTLCFNNSSFTSYQHSLHSCTLLFASCHGSRIGDDTCFDFSSFHNFTNCLIGNPRVSLMFNHRDLVLCSL